MAKKDIESQIKKGGLKENFICLPDPSDPYKWYYVVYGLEEPKEYKGGYYLGVITCPDTYPAKAPRIDILTENGRFRVKEKSEGICLSISHHHPESWNPAWKVNQIVIGLISFWITNEDTYGAFYDHEFKNQKDFTPSENRQIMAMESREHVLSHEKFIEIFGEYTEALGIKTAVAPEEWTPLIAKKEKVTLRLAEEAEKKRIADEEAAEK